MKNPNVLVTGGCGFIGSPICEDLRPQPESPYAVAKVAGEHYLRLFASLYALPTQACCALMHEAFGVINADDFYGRAYSTRWPRGSADAPSPTPTTS